MSIVGLTLPPSKIAATVIDMVKNRIPAKFGFDPIRDIQVLCPMNRGCLGVRELNLRLQNALNPARGDEPVRDYIAEQEEHHRRISFQDEFRLVLRRYHIEFDERILAAGVGGLEGFERVLRVFHRGAAMRHAGLLT